MFTSTFQAQTFREVVLGWVFSESHRGGVELKEASCTKRSSSLQDTVIPRFFGFFKGIVSKHEVGCVITEWCSDEPIKDKEKLK